VHGQCNGPNGSRAGHAWILAPDGRVYDPVLDRWFTEAAYRDFVAAVPERQYTLEQAAAALLLLAADHYGPWH